MHEAYHSPPGRAVVKNLRSCTTIPSMPSWRAQTLYIYLTIVYNTKTRNAISTLAELRNSLIFETRPNTQLSFQLQLAEIIPSW